ncbi:unnamed protein product [Didymodactylos carnosus]|uniref:Tetratricopeptide repeat protein n=1 Tax=Didymodactylos carnosus TaxID=1234261 RepID=A0A815ZZH1_9BILA|nr:unnamed protein product [Didymodactylos carnosus]CAF1588953.1 unnamed protein product [Didymodactylos carnosus]CAF4186041.1 unnamed protein product [Didymodactylos carnosus]CAF4460178.1 unnamed protein product [Didymodactylos carnosus]
MNTKDLHRIVGIYKKNGKYETATTFCNKKLVEQRANLPENHPRIGHTLKTIGDVYSETNGSQALEYYREALTIFENCIPSDQKAIIDCLEHISNLYYNQGFYNDVLKCRTHAPDIQQILCTFQNPIIGLSLEWRGGIYSDMKNYSQALEYFKRTLAIYQANYIAEYKRIKDIQQFIIETENKLNETIESIY